MTRTGLSARLANHRPDPFIEMNRDDATELGLTGGGFARVSTEHGAIVLRVSLTAAQKRGRIFAAIHWSDETAGEARICLLVHAFTDPFSGQPDSKAVPAALARVSYAAHGFVFAREKFKTPWRLGLGVVSCRGRGFALRRDRKVQRSRARCFSGGADIEREAHRNSVPWAASRRIAIQRSRKRVCPGTSFSPRRPSARPRGSFTTYRPVQNPGTSSVK
jgi:assimilatory nitrate reductase catalytic subunit